MFVRRSITLITLITSTGIAHAKLVDVTLNNGDMLKADLISQTNKTITLNHPVLGKLIIDKSKITQLVDDQQQVDTTKVAESSTPAKQAEAKSGQDVSKHAEVTTVDEGLFGTGLLTDWSRRLDLGLAGSAGKSSSAQINVGFSADFTNKYTRISSKTAYYRSQSDGTMTANSFYSSLNRDWLRPDSPWFEFGGGRVDWDKFKDWDYRASVNGGMGYEFLNNDEWLLDGRTGLGFSQTFGGTRHDFTPEGLLGFEAKWHINNHQKLHISNSLYPALNDIHNYRNLTSLDWILDLNTLVGVALKVGLTNEYDSRNQGNVNKNDFKYTASLAWTL